MQVKYERNDNRGGYDHYNGGGDRGMGYSQQQQQQQHQPPVDPRLYNPAQQQQQPLQSTPQLEQAQKAQQILSMLTHQQQQHAQPAPSAYQPGVSLTSPSVPSQPHLLQQPFVQPVPPTEDQASQVQQLLGLLVKIRKRIRMSEQILTDIIVLYRVKLLLSNNSNSSINTN